MSEKTPAGRPWPRIRLRRGVFWLLFFGASICMAVLAVEVVGRLVLGDGPYYVQLFCPDPHLIYRNRPGFNRTLAKKRVDRQNLPPMPVRISSQGLRGREYMPKDENTYRVVMLGDSLTFGWGLPESESIPRQLEARLRAEFSGTAIEVVNGGVSGYAPWQAHGLFAAEAEWLDPDMVILQTFTGNDLADTLTQLEGELAALASYRVWRLRLVRRLRLLGPISTRMDHWLLSHSWLYYYGCLAFDTDLVITRAKNTLGLGRPIMIPPLPPRVDRPFPYEPHLCESYPRLEQAWSLFQKDIRALEAACRAQDSAFAVYNIPYPLDRSLADTALAGMPDGLYCPDKGNRRIESFFSEEGIPHVPMLELFRKHPAPLKLLLSDNHHLNKEGGAVVASALVEGLFTGGLP